MKPRRVQLRRTKGWRLPPNTIVCSRPSKWGNPWRVGWDPVLLRTLTAQEAVDEFRASIGNLLPYTRADIRRELRGKSCGCWCRLDQPCHADVLMEVANA